MSDDFKSARHWARELISAALLNGARAIDATMGNGHDTQWLCQLVGPQGHVWAFDIQQGALDHTKARLEACGMAGRATLVRDGHQNMAKWVTGPVAAIVSNLGWLPGADKSTRTQPDTTICAAEAGLTLLGEGGLMTICVYPGHEEGAVELERLRAWAAQLPPQRYDAMIRAYVNQPNDPPVMFAVRRRPGV